VTGARSGHPITTALAWFPGERVFRLCHGYLSFFEFRIILRRRQLGLQYPVRMITARLLILSTASIPTHLTDQVYLPFNPDFRHTNENCECRVRSEVRAMPTTPAHKDRGKCSLQRRIFEPPNRRLTPVPVCAMSGDDAVERHVV